MGVDLDRNLRRERIDQINNLYGVQLRTIMKVVYTTFKTLLKHQKKDHTIYQSSTEYTTVKSDIKIAYKILKAIIP